MFAIAFVVASLLRLAASPVVTPPEQQAVSAAPAQPAQTNLMLDVTVHAYNEAGYHSASAGNRGLETFESYVWLSETCEMGSSGRPPATAPRSSYIWHFTGKVLERMRRIASSDEPDELSALTPQERKILALVAEGKTNKEIASDVFLSDKTVKNYVSSILAKLNLERRAQAAAYVARLKTHSSD
jgi:DNA-binding CsgD family transcriptional regulator